MTTTFTTNAYTLAIGDANTVQIANNGATAATITVPPHSIVAFASGTLITFVCKGSGKIQLAEGAGVTIHAPIMGDFVSGSTGNRAQYSSMSLYQDASNSWVLSGDIA